MADITLKGLQLPFVLGGTGALTIRAQTTARDQPLSSGVDVLLSVETGASASKPLTLGGRGSWTMSLKTDGCLELHAVRARHAALVGRYGLGGYFAGHRDGLVMLLTAGGSAGGAFAGRFRYAALTPTATVEAGGDVDFAYARAYPPDTTLDDLVEHFFRNVRLPAAVDRPLDAGEVIKFEYGGYLKVGAGLSLGYEMNGTPSVDIGQLKLSEHYVFSAIGKLGVTAQIGGFFGIEMHGPADDTGAPTSGWTRVVVHKTRASEFSFAADASVEASANLKGLPKEADELLGALLGVNVKNWLNLLTHVNALTTLDGLTSGIDDLAMDFLATWLGKQIGADTLPELLAKVATVVAQYEAVDTTIISALERYFDELTDPAHGNEVAAAVHTLAVLPSWDSLRGEIDPIVWKLVTELTDGDPLGWMLEKNVSALQHMAAGLLDVAGNAARKELRDMIALATHQFTLDRLFTQLATIDTVPELKAQAGQRLGGLIQRLLGDDIKRIQDTALIARLRATLDKIQTFKEQAYEKLIEAAKQTCSFNLHAEYSRAAEADALVDILIDASTPEGLALLHAASLGDFQQALACYRPDLVRLNHGRLTHTLVKQRALSVNVVGWHAGWRYQGLEKLILHTDQQIVTDDRGGLTVYTTVDVTKNADRKSAHARTYTNFLLRFLGESHGVIPDEAANLAYLIDTITSMSAQYDLGFEDDRTTFDRLSYYLSFARDFGLVGASVQAATLAALLPQQGADDFGKTAVTYHVRYEEAGLKTLFGQPLDEQLVRRVMRQVILGGHLRTGGALAAMAWAYWTRGVYDFWSKAPESFVSAGPREFRPIQPSPFPELPAPPRAVVQPDEQRKLDVLYRVEDGFVRGFRTLESLIQGGREGRRMSSRQFENALGAIGDALQLLDRFGELPNTTFAVFDSLVQDAGGAARASSLTLTSQAAGRQVRKVFLSPARETDARV